MTETSHKLDDLVLRLLMQLWIANDSAAPDISSFQFELRFDQRQSHTLWSYQVEGRRQDGLEGAQEEGRAGPQGQKVIPAPERQDGGGENVVLAASVALGVTHRLLFRLTAPVA